MGRYAISGPYVFSQGAGYLHPLPLSSQRQQQRIHRALSAVRHGHTYAFHSWKTSFRFLLKQLCNTRRTKATLERIRSKNDFHTFSRAYQGPMDHDYAFLSVLMFFV